MRVRGQTSVVGFLIITLIILVIVSGTFFWAKGLLSESKQFNEFSRVKNRMLELDKAIREVVNEQSQRSVKFEIEDGTLYIKNNHTITYAFGKPLPKALRGRDVVILGNSSSDGPCFYYDIKGVLGVDRSSCIVKRGDEISIKYIVLNETNTNNCYSVQFESGGNAAAGKGTHNILITYSHTNVTSNCNASYTRVVKIDID